MVQFLYPSHPARVINTGPSKSGNSCFLTDLIFDIINDFEEIISIHHFYVKICFKNYIHVLVSTHQ